MNCSLDASAMVAYLNGEPGASVVAGLLADEDNLCYAHAINLCEVFYGTLRATDEITARAAIASLFADGVIPRRDMSQQFGDVSHDSKPVAESPYLTASALFLPRK